MEVHLSGLDRYAPNGMPWIYRVSEEKTSGLSGVRKRQCPVWQHGKSVPDSRDHEFLTDDLQNSRSSGRTRQEKTVTNDYLGYDLTASFKLQAATSSDASFDAGSASWMDADALFTDETRDQRSSMPMKEIHRRTGASGSRHRHLQERSMLLYGKTGKR